VDKKEQRPKAYYVEEDCVHIYTDASFNHATKKGTYGCCVISIEGYKYLYGEFIDVSCITDCEIKAVMNALDFYNRVLRKSQTHKTVKIYTDSQPTIQHLTSAREDIKNINSKFFYVKKFYIDIVDSMNIDVTFFKVKAHVDNMSSITLVNDFCDRMSKAYMSISILEANKPLLKIHSNRDVGYDILDKFDNQEEDAIPFLYDNINKVGNMFLKRLLPKLKVKLKTLGYEDSVYIAARDICRGKLSTSTE
jgi:ribonuclease HI